MEAVRDNKRNKLFIPSSMGTSSVKFFNQKAIIISAIEVSTFAFSMVAMAVLILYYTPVFSLALLFIFLFFIVDSWIHIKIARRFVLREPELMEKYNDYRKNQKTTVKTFYDVVNFQKDGRILFTSGEECYVIKLEREYVYGRPANFKATHNNAITSIYTDLLAGGYNLRYYNYKIGDTNTKGLEATSDNLVKYGAKSKLSKLALEIINYNRDLVGNVPTEIEFLMVFTDGSSQKSNFLAQDINLVLQTYKETLYENAHIMDKEEIMQFCQKYFSVDFIDVNELSQKILGGKKLDVFKVTGETAVAKVFTDDDDLEMGIDDSAADDLFSQFNN